MRPIAPLPPGFTAMVTAADVCAEAALHAEAGADPGLVLHNELTARCTMAVVLTPDRPIDDAAMLDLAARAVHHALAALAPVRIPVEISGHGITVNGGQTATLTLRRSPADALQTPDWLVLGIDVAVDLREAAPGHHPGRTCLREEGFDASAAEIMSGVCRHLLAAIDAWTDGMAEAAA
jgi:hypothetical protein